MKKIIAIVMAVAVVATLGIVAFAEVTGDKVDLGDGEADGENDAVPPVEEPTVEEPTESANDTPEPSEVISFIDTNALVSALTSAPFWFTAASILGTAIGFLTILKNKLKSINGTIGNTATYKQLESTGDKITEALIEKIETAVAPIKADLRNNDENIKLVLTCFTIFAESAKINPNAKKEILDYLTNVKSVSSDVLTTVKKAIHAIEEANAAETPILTPKTDEAINTGDTAPFHTMALA